MYFDKLHSKPVTLREVLTANPEFIPCVYDCLSATIIEQAGFKAMCFSGASFAASFTGLPDIGLVTPTEVKTMVSNITKVAKIPMIVDIDTGYGNELNAIRTCVDMAEAGAMALHMEDQVFPKRCGHLNGKRVVPRDEYIRKVRAVADALKGSDCMLIARTDSYLEYGVEEAIERNLRSLEAGADIAFTEGTRTVADIERVAREVDGWNMFDMCHKGASPDVSFEDLCQMGYRLVTSPLISIGGAMKGISEYAAKSRKQHNDFFVSEDGITVWKLFQTLGIDEWYELGSKYDPSMNLASETEALD
jgi:methylisocitrate lyase